ncbi:Smr/MutS family protein [Novosphingobium sp. TH158]|uniref:Smr/MutS family protein n=1 Tax=Novosphingobium sp. TH158 TaxID=2067455 RepID=UPI000C7C5BD6|nr:Smr/MutS family protein [Novosphingobium sp. TH158]PLK24342.1 DNA mismatch repair protein MutS [Novosphingobium sp. TH158]
MRRPRKLSGEEAALWSRVAATVKPLHGARMAMADLELAASPDPAMRAARTKSAQAPAAPQPVEAPRPGAEAPRSLVRHGLDATWDRKLLRGVVSPDFTIDLHGHSLDAAWSRLEHGLHLAHSQGVRMVLVITGRPRPVDRGAGHGQRGVIRAKLLDWLAHGSHASKIAAVRGAHPRHGGAGAVYVVLRRK